MVVTAGRSVGAVIDLAAGGDELFRFLAHAVGFCEAVLSSSFFMDLMY